MRQALQFWTRQRSEAIWLVGIVGLATAVATAVWSIASAVWLAPLSFAEPDRLVSLGWTDERYDQRIAQTSIEEFQDLKEATGALYDLAGWEDERSYLLLGDRPVEIDSAAATANLLDVLGVQPLLGRRFQPDDVQSGTTAVISYRLWNTVFNRDPDMIGREVVVGSGSGTRPEKRVRIVGVLPEHAALRKTDADEIALIIPVPDGARADVPSSRRAYRRRLLARLKPGVTQEIAAAETTRLFRAIDRTTGLFDRTRAASVVTLHEQWFGRAKPFLTLLAVASAFLLLVAAANGTGIMLALSSRRAREMSVRIAIGAGRRHLIAQAIRESLVIGLGSAVVAVAVATGVVRLFIEWGPPGVPRLSDASLDGATMGFAILMTAGFCLVLGLAPTVIRRRRDVLSILQSGGTTSTVSRRALRVRQVAIACQLAVVLALLAAAGLVTGTLRHMLNQPLGFALDRVSAARVRPTQPYFKDPHRYAEVREVARRAALSVPEVSAAALTIDPPLSSGASNMRVQFLDQPPKFIGTKMVSEGFFDVMQIPLLAGRDFEAADMVAGDAVIVNELFARTYYDDIAGAIGREIEFAGRQHIVGVVGNVREEGIVASLRPIIYPVFSQRWTPGEFHLVVRHRGGAAAVEPLLETALQRVDPTSHVEVAALADRLRVQTSIARTQSAALGVLAVVVLLLAAAGVYATVAQMVEDRRRELGIRSALGASGRSLVLLTARSVAMAAALGIGGGAALSLLVARVTRQFLFEMTPFDPRVWGIAATTLLVTAAIAAWWPARRAASVVPSVVLRGD